MKSETNRIVEKRVCMIAQRMYTAVASSSSTYTKCYYWVEKRHNNAYAILNLYVDVDVSVCLYVVFSVFLLLARSFFPSIYLSIQPYECLLCRHICTHCVYSARCKCICIFEYIAAGRTHSTTLKPKVIVLLLLIRRRITKQRETLERTNNDEEAKKNHHISSVFRVCSRFQIAFACNTAERFVDDLLVQFIAIPKWKRKIKVWI